MRKIDRFFMKFLVCAVLFLVLAIICKSNVSYKNYIKEKFFQQSLSFSYFKNFYNRYLGGIFPIENVDKAKTSTVFKEELVYSKLESYEEGAKVTVEENYLVPSMEEGIVVYIGEKDKYNQVIMVENALGIDVWYGNIGKVNVSLYDQVEKGDYLGEVEGDWLYLVYTKGTQFLNYQDYLS